MVIPLFDDKEKRAQALVLKIKVKHPVKLDAPALKPPQVIGEEGMIGGPVTGQVVLPVSYTHLTLPTNREV